MGGYATDNWFFIVFGCVVLGYLEAKGNLGALWQPAELIIIVGAAMGAMVVAHPVAVLKGIGGQLKTLLGKGYTQDYYRAIIELMFELLETVRKDGIKSWMSTLKIPTPVRCSRNIQASPLRRCYWLSSPITCV